MTLKFSQIQWDYINDLEKITNSSKNYRTWNFQKPLYNETEIKILSATNPKKLRGKTKQPTKKTILILLSLTSVVCGNI